MAVLFDEIISDNRYRVTKAGSSIRLYTNGLFHSQFNEATILSGAVWDLLFLPSLAVSSTFQKALILGVGGGAVLRMLNYVHKDLSITGVDINPVHNDLARRFFGVQDGDYELITANALSWVNQQKRTKFNYIVDDVFAGRLGDPNRSISVSPQWVSCLERRLTVNGVLVFNFDRSTDLNRSINDLQRHNFKGKTFNELFTSAIKLACPGYENSILMLSKNAINAKQLEQLIVSHPVLSERKLSKNLKFVARNIKL
jgi:spermidine synthase